MPGMNFAVAKPALLAQSFHKEVIARQKGEVKMNHLEFLILFLRLFLAVTAVKKSLGQRKRRQRRK